MRPLLACLSVLLLLGCSKPSPPGPNPGAIVPGQGTTEVKLGMDRAEVEKALGRPEATEGNPFNPRNTLALYHARGIELSYDGDLVGSIVLHRAAPPWSSYQGSTAEGIWVESTPDDVRRVYGEPARELQQALIYQSKGLWFRLDREGRIESISLGG